MRAIVAILAAASAVLLFALPGRAAELSGASLVRALARGGYVMVMRHASSPDRPPSAKDADPGNPARERQLDAMGRQAAREMGTALRKLHIPVGAILSSPTYRARETVRMMGFARPKIFAELGDAGHSMQAAAVAGWAGWLRQKVNEPPKRGTDTLIVTQTPNVDAAFGGEAKGLKAGGALIYRPQGHRVLELIGRIAIADWPKLAAQTH